jgi:hypothetical protein
MFDRARDLRLNVVILQVRPAADALYPSPSGHFLISVIGNYDIQEPAAGQIAAIAKMMTWALHRFDLRVDSLGGHYLFAGTSCPGQHLRVLLEDGTLSRLVQARL